MMVGFVSLPVSLHAIGLEQFGILTLAWAVLGYFTLFDLGLGRASTKFIAHYAGHPEDVRLREVIWTSLAMQAALGVIGGLALAFISPALVEKVLKISPGLAEETKAVFVTLSLSLPILLVGNLLRGVLEAMQRFDLINMIRIWINSSIFLIPMLAIPFGLRLRTIVFLIVGAKLLEALCYLALNTAVIANLWQEMRFNREIFARLASFGRWITITNVVGPLLTYADRFLIGMLHPVNMVAYYTLPYEAITKLWIVPGSLLTTLFPAFSKMNAAGSSEQLRALCMRATKFLLLFMVPVVSVAAFFSHEILNVWVGPDFAAHSRTVLKLLAFGVLINSLAMVPCVFLQAIGRPEIPAKYNLIELPLYLSLLWLLVSRWGIVGAALAWTFRVSLDAFLLFGTIISLRLAAKDFSDKRFQNTILLVLIHLAAFFAASALSMGVLLYRALSTMVIIVFFCYGTWKFALDDNEKIKIVEALQLNLAVVKAE